MGAEQERPGSRGLCGAINRVVRASSSKDKLSRVNSIASVICGGVRIHRLCGVSGTS